MLEHEEKELIRKVITGMTYHEKYRLYKSLGENLNEKDALAALLAGDRNVKRGVKMKTPSRSLVESDEIEEG